MMTEEQIMQLLQALRQKNNAGDGVMANSPIPAAGIPQQQMQQGGGHQTPSMLGFLGGLGDTQNANGGIDPSMLSRWNQGIMGMTGQGNGYQPFPWQQQPSGQQMGQDVSGSLKKLLGYFS